MMRHSMAKRQEAEALKVAKAELERDLRPRNAEPNGILEQRLRRDCHRPRPPHLTLLRDKPDISWSSAPN